MNMDAKILNKILGPPGVTQLAGHHPANRKVASLIPGQGAGLGAPSQAAYGRQPINVSLHLFLPPLPFL